MLQAIAKDGSHRQVWWLYVARNGEEHPFAAEVRTLLAELSGARSHIWYSRPGDKDVIGRDYDSAGRVDVSGLAAMGVTSSAQFYLCGPPSFLEAVTAGLVAWGVARERIYSEAFGSSPSVTPGVVGGKTKATPHPPPGPAGKGPSISFARAGLVATWSPAYHSLLEFAEACDVPVRWQCRTGVCHTCESGLLSGDVDYSPEPLDAPAVGNLLICCSRPRDDVVLDL